MTGADGDHQLPVDSGHPGTASEPPTEPDPQEVAVRPAATVMLLDDGPRLRVLLLRRTSQVVFGPGNWVFPGGRVDPGDHVDDFDRLCEGLSDTEASSILGVERGGLAWWVAACRETLEEAGLLLSARTGPPVSAGDVASLRDRVRADEGLFIDLLLAAGITLDVRGIEEVARFITPVGPPRRFDARFFVARAPEGQEALHDDDEIVDWAWFEPDTALERWRAGELEMMSPTARMVACLARFRSVDEVMEVASRRLPYRRVRVADPEGRYDVLLPGEPGYESADLEVESGWVRLWTDDGSTG